MPEQNKGALKPGNQLVERLLARHYNNATYLAECLSKHAGKQIHRQQVSRWLQGKGMTVETYQMLAGYKAKPPKPSRVRKESYTV